MNGANGLFNSTILDVGLGLLCIYLLLAVITSALNEWLASWFNLRGRNLKAAITQLLDGQSGNDDAGNDNKDANWFLNEFYKHPLIAGMHSPDNASHPSYLSSRTFSGVVMDIATPGIAGSISFDNLQAGIQKLPNGDVRTALLAVIQNAQGKLPVAQQNIEHWFDDTMQRMGGWYKKKIHLLTVCVAVLLVVGTNADTIRMSYILWRNPTQRAQIVERAKARSTTTGNTPAAGSTPTTSSTTTNTTPTTGGTPATGTTTTGASPTTNSTQTTGNTPTGSTPTQIRDANNDELQDLDNLLGWQSQETMVPKAEKWKVWARRGLGWFLTIVAVSLGAPFWFDLLNKIVNLRNTGIKPKPADDLIASAAVAAPPTTPSAPVIVVPTPPQTPGSPPAPISAPPPAGAPVGVSSKP